MASNSKKSYSPPDRLEHNIKRYTAHWFYLEDLARYKRSILHIGIQDAYENILRELTTIEGRFYDDFDARNHGRSVTKNDWTEFVIPKILNMLEVIYRMKNYSLTSDDELINDDNSESDEEPAKIELYTPKIASIRMQCAKLILREWSNETHWGPRVGVMAISTMEEGAEKVLLVFHVKNGVAHFGYPKGKPNLGETIRVGGFREFKEEIGVHDLFNKLQINEDDGKIIKKRPHIGRLNQRRSRLHYYVILTTPSQFNAFRPQKNEILGVEWHSIYMIPCCDQCKIRQKRMNILNDDGIPIDYHMVTLRDVNNKDPAILEILAYVDGQNGNKNAYFKYLRVHDKCGHDLV